MKKASRRILIALAATVILVLSITGGAMAAGPYDGDCPNDGICQNDGVCPNDGTCLYDGEGPADGTGLQTRTQANMASSRQNQYANQFNTNGNCNNHQYSNAYRYGYGLIAE